MVLAMKFQSLIFVILSALLVVACATPPKMILKPVPYSDLKGWDEAKVTQAMPALMASCEIWLKRAEDLAVKHIGGVAGWWQKPCQTLIDLQPLQPTDKALRHVFEAGWMPVAVMNHANPEGLFTGYYEIDLRGSRTKTEQYRYPLYGLPEGEKPLPTRAEIEDGALDGSGLELVYVDDPVQLYFLHVQGSGRVNFEDGSVMSVTYAGQNGYDYVSIGKILIEDEVITQEAMTAPVLKTWLREHPSAGVALMRQNPSYIFFRSDETKKPIGAAGLPVWPEHSLAVDKRFIPYHVPLWLETTLPVDAEGVPVSVSEAGVAEQTAVNYRRMMVAQDTGGAIRGVVRGDVFFGGGERAELLAGHMKQTGRYYLMLPRAYQTIFADKEQAGE